MGRQGLLAMGNFIVDDVKLIDAWPKQDGLALIRSESRSNGGGPYNVLKDLAALKLEFPLEACGLIGHDAYGEWMLQDCAASGIDCAQLKQTQASASSYTDVMTASDTGRRTFFHQLGTNALLSKDNLDLTKSNAKLFYFGYLMLLAQLDALNAKGETEASLVLAKAQEQGFKTIVDCVSSTHPNFKQVALAALRHSDVFFANELELGQLVGETISSSLADLASVAPKLFLLSESCLFVLHSIEGACVVDCKYKRVVKQPAIAFPKEKIVGANGAGDAFAAGFLAAFHEDESIETCLHYAVCVAAMSLSQASTSGGIKPLAECLALADSYGFLNQA